MTDNTAWAAAVARGETTDSLQAWLAAQEGARRAEALTSPESLKEWRIPVHIQTTEWYSGAAIVHARNEADALAAFHAGQAVDVIQDSWKDADTNKIEVEEGGEIECIGLAPPTQEA